MAIRYIPNNIRGLKFVEQASWAGGDPGSGYTALKAFDITFEPKLGMIIPQYQKPEGCRGPDTPIPAGKGGTLSFKTYLRGGASAESEFSKLAKNCGLTRTARAAGSGKVTDATSSTIVALTADIGAYVVGDGLLVSGTGTNTQYRFISRVQDDVPGASSTTVTVECNYADTPVATDSFYAVDTFTPTEAALGEPTKYMTFKFYTGGDATEKHLWTLTGCAGTWKLNATNANTLPVIEWTYMVDSWASAETATTVTADAYNPASPLLGDPFYANNDELKIKSLAFDPGLKLVPYETTAGTHGRSGWFYVETEPKLEFETLWDINWITYWATATEYQFTFQSIKDTDESWALHVPSVAMIEPGIAEVNSLIGLKPEWVVTDPGVNADSANLPLWALSVTGSGS